MYHEEKTINGVLHFRTTPKGEFKPYSLKAMTMLIEGYRKRIIRLENDKISKQ